MGVLDALRTTRASLAEHEAAKTEEERARREAERDPAVVEAAQMLGMKDSEIVSVAEADEGLIIVTSDRVELVLVPPDQPDAAGKVGLMFLVKPRGDMVTDFPVYTHEGDTQPVVPVETDPGKVPPAALVELIEEAAPAEQEQTTEAPGPDDAKPLAERSKKELLATIDDLRADGKTIDIPPKATNADLVALIEEAD